ncbi:MAG: hydroxymethylglutaryl-CoA lyase, partial [Ginsengibacter sp.]
QVASLTQKVIAAFPGIEIGVHLHSTQTKWKEKIDAALQQGCLRFDGALKGIGGCPMAGDELVGNMDSGLMIAYFKELGYCRQIDNSQLKQSFLMAEEIFA